VEEPFVSPSTDAAVSASFGALSASVALQNSEMIDGLAREMLRPMLKTWLDDNLPSLVERLVRAEIQRVARGGR
jgi:cell pole-organizing protein PopZ